MIQTITLPDLGEGLTESDLVEWTVAVGDTVALNQVVAEVETAKALVQLPSPCAGVVAELLVQAGATVPVGAPLLTITVDEPSVVGDDAGPVGDGAADEPDEAETVVDDGAAAAMPAAPERTAVLVGYGPLVEASSRPRRRARSAAWVAAHVVDEVVIAGRPIGPRVLPPVRKLAHDLGVDLNRVQGTGKDGLITREDVLHVVSGDPSSPVVAREAAIRPPAPAPRASAPRVAAPASAPRERRTPVTGVRKQTAAAMVASAFTAPHASTSVTVDVTPALELLEHLRADRAMAGHRLTILTLVAKAVTIALGRNPSLNARWDEAAGEIVEHSYVNLGIAAATPRGLLVPSIKDAERLRLPELADAIDALVEAARAGTTTPADLTGGTVTITNIGVFGVDTGTPILVPGQATILAIGAIRRRPWEFQDEIALRHVMTLSVSFDHRLVDGAEAAHFLTDVAGILARPGSVLSLV